MADFERTISELQSRLCSGANELPLWQAKAMQHWFTAFVNITMSHHDHEEQVSSSSVGLSPCCKVLASPSSALSLL